MRQIFNAYRDLALIVGVLLTVLVFVAMPLKYFPADGSQLQTIGEQLVSIIGITHGWFYMGYLVAACLLIRRTTWSTGFKILVLAAGLIPILIFWVESQVAGRVREEFPEVT